MSKTKVIVSITDKNYSNYKMGEEGYIDGYVRSSNDFPCAVVVIRNKLVMVPIHHLRVVTGESTRDTTYDNINKIDSSYDYTKPPVVKPVVPPTPEKDLPF